MPKILSIRSLANDMVKQNVVMMGIAGGAIKMIMAAISITIVFPGSFVLRN